MGFLSTPLSRGMNRAATVWWTDIPNGYVTPAPGLIAIGFGSANHGGADNSIAVNGLTIWDYHQAGDWSASHSAVVPAGATITFYGSRGIRYAKFMACG